MARNIEIKARIENAHQFKQRLHEMTPQPAEIILQTDTFFNVAEGRLKLRDFRDGSAELIFYHRSNATEPTCSSYWRSSCEPDSMLELLTRAHGIRGVVKKRRELYLLEQTRIHFDEVDGLGTFCELEVVLEDQQTESAGQSVARELMQSLMISDDDLVDGAYVDLLEHSAVTSRA